MEVYRLLDPVVMEAIRHRSVLTIITITTEIRRPPTTVATPAAAAVKWSVLPRRPLLTIRISNRLTSLLLFHLRLIIIISIISLPRLRRRPPWIISTIDPYSQTLNSLHQSAQVAAAAHHYNHLTVAAVSAAGQRHDALRRAENAESIHVVSIFIHNMRLTMEIEFLSNIMLYHQQYT